MMQITMHSDMKKLSEFYKDQLLKNCLPFWYDNGLDQEQGGFLTCLDREGALYNTDKSVWFQGRALWMFSRAFLEADADPRWIEAAQQIYPFLRDTCYDTDGRMFFQVLRDGTALQKRRYYFSETFAVIGTAEYYRATGLREALHLARSTWDTCMDLYRHPEKSTPKYNPEALGMRSLGPPMILLATAQVLRTADTERTETYDAVCQGFVEDILKYFYKPGMRALLENTGPDGAYLNTPKGRLVNPGHAIEAAWFIMNESLRCRRPDWMSAALDILEWSLEIGWDKTHGGLMSFMDIEGRPCEQLEWDMKLWWPHTEALIALCYAWRITGDDRWKEWLVRMHNYAFLHFADKEKGEWFGYLHRDGSVSCTLKGSMFKGPFHLPRALLMCGKILGAGEAVPVF